MATGQWLPLTYQGYAIAHQPTLPNPLLLSKASPPVPLTLSRRRGGHAVEKRIYRLSSPLASAIAPHPWAATEEISYRRI
jgi:hypothetical protein